MNNEDDIKNGFIGGRAMTTTDPEVEMLIHSIKATETLTDAGRVIVHDDDVYLGEFDIACCLQHCGPSFRELSDHVRFARRTAQ